MRFWLLRNKVVCVEKNTCHLCLLGELMFGMVLWCVNNILVSLCSPGCGNLFSAMGIWQRRRLRSLRRGGHCRYLRPYISFNMLTCFNFKRFCTHTIRGFIEFATNLYLCCPLMQVAYISCPIVETDKTTAEQLSKPALSVSPQEINQRHHWHRRSCSPPH